MADPLSSGPRRSEALSGADDDARIEQLLVTGLDHYFAGEFEPAINVWTRVLFLDRSHDRARAYIERARSAQAENLRASEALVHQGLEAFDRGDVARARELLHDAIDGGASHDLALGVLGRIDRLDVPQRRTTGPSPAPDARPRRFARTAPSAPRERGQRRMRVVIAVAVAVLAATAAAVWSVSPAADRWWPASPVAEPSVVAALPVSPLPVPAPTEAYLASARNLFAGGKVRDALRVLDRVPVGDRLRPDADRLRAEIQRELLASAAVDMAPAPPVPPGQAPSPE